MFVELVFAGLGALLAVDALTDRAEGTSVRLFEGLIGLSTVCLMIGLLLGVGR